MSEIRVDKVADEAGTGAVELTQGATLPSGKTLSGSGTIAVNSTGTAAGLTGTPSITVADITGIGANLSGITTTAGIKFNKQIFEEVNVTAGKLSDNTEINISNGQVHLFTTAESTTSTPNIMSTTGINTDMSVGESLVVTIITTANASAYSANITIDSVAVTENWVGGSAPDAGGSSGVDIHSFTIIKTGSAAYTVIGNHSKTS
nr:hypothetical protein [uncultured Mediterranean phage uvMED]